MSSPRARRHTSDDFGRFIKSWLQNPLATGAVAPSGRPLARLMANGLQAGHRVVELGAGTGTLTRAILDAGVRPPDLKIVEQNPEFVQILQRRFPDCPIVAADAMALVDTLGASAPYDFVISGLPLLLFNPEQKQRLLEQIFAVLGTRGCLHQFTYGGRCPVDRGLRRKLGVESSLVGFAAFNLPPAFVYRFSREAQP
jgi:phospholipid N-methyltransferase